MSNFSPSFSFKFPERMIAETSAKPSVKSTVNSESKPDYDLVYL